MYVEYHDHFSNEVYQATACYVIWKNLQSLPARDRELLEKLNENALSWVFIRHSMMLGLIMALGRIFDTDGDSISIDDLIKSCISNLNLFSKESLRERKMKGSSACEWIDSYIDSAYEPVEKDFHRLKPEVKNTEKYSTNTINH